jgi:hypothetical protein
MNSFASLPLFVFFFSSTHPLKLCDKLLFSSISPLSPAAVSTLRSIGSVHIFLCVSLSFLISRRQHLCRILFHIIYRHLDDMHVLLPIGRSRKATVNLFNMSELGSYDITTPSGQVAVAVIQGSVDILKYQNLCYHLIRLSYFCYLKRVLLERHAIPPSDLPVALAVTKERLEVVNLLLQSGGIAKGVNGTDTPLINACKSV